MKDTRVDTMGKETDSRTAATGIRNCGECLMNDVEIVQLDAKGKCPRCGADYGKPATR